jgi:hypothetical protein
MSPTGITPIPSCWSGCVVRCRPSGRHRRRSPLNHPGSLFAEACRLAAIDDAALALRDAAADDLVMPLHLTLGGFDLRLFTTIATIGAPLDVTVEEFRLETLLPANAATEQTLRHFAGDAVPADLRQPADAAVSLAMSVRLINRGA